MSERTAPRSKLSFERLLQITFAVLVSLGALLLGIGQGNTMLPLAMLVTAAAGVSLYVTDCRGWIQVHRAIANGLALLAVAFWAANFFRVATEEQLLAVARVLIFLQTILLFQRKTNRIYWQLLVLSVLQVVIGAVINLKIMFGLLLILYMFVALAAMRLLFIRRESQRWLKLVAAAETANHNQKSSHPIRVSTLLPADSATELLGGGILRRTLGLGLGTLIVTAVCFFSLPRLGQTALGLSFGQAHVGYSPEVKLLGSLGPMLQDASIVMRVDFRDANGPVAPVEPPLFRGSLVNEYHRGGWKWNRPATGFDPGAILGTSETEGLVIEHIAIEPLSAPVLFSVYPLFTAQETRPVLFDFDRQQLIRRGNVQRDRFEFKLMTSGWRQGHPSRIIPRGSVPRESEEMSDSEQFDLTELPSPLDKVDELTGLKKLDRKTVADAGLDSDDAYGKAKALERLLSSPPFEYTLDRGPPTPGVDPIEDFVTKNQRGHCEYFASALTLMLRSQYIPARMVIGYHGGEWNTVGSYFDVRQLHAHAWVEAYLKPRQIPASERPPGMKDGVGGWLVLDPTPASGLAGTVADPTFFSSLGDFADYVETLWNSYVVGLNADRQKRMIYEPLGSARDALKQAWQNPLAMLSDLWDNLRRWWKNEDHFAAGGWFRWQTLLVLAWVAGFVLIAYAVRLNARIVRKYWRRRRGVHKRAGPSDVEFYRRFETLMAGRGLMRRANQTQLEFAQLAGRALAATAQRPAAALLANRIVEAFYRVRFGHAPLDSRQTATVEQLLGELRQLVTGGQTGLPRMNGNERK